MSRRKIIAVWAVITALTVILVLILAACGHRRGQVAQLTVTPPTQDAPESSEQTDSDSDSVLPPVMALDGCIAVTRGVSEDETVTSQGWEAYRDGQTGTNGTSGLNVETEGTALTLRAYALGEYAYAVYGQAIGSDPKPLKSLIDCDPCAFGGGQDDDIPLSYFVGIADYSIGSWRWFGPFGEVDVMITVNSEVLKSRFKSPADNFYLCVLASNGSKAASALPDEGLVADFPIEPVMRAVSEEDDDPGGLTIEEICTWVEDNLLTDPAVVTGLSASVDTWVVILTWDTNLDPDVDIYQVFRDDLDDEDPPTLLQGVLAPTVEYWDHMGVPGKEYQYAVRARNDAGYGGRSFANATRELEAPYVTATYGYYEDKIVVNWTEIEGAVLYRLYRGETDLKEDAELLAGLDAETTSYEDTEPPIGEVRWYWVRAVGEDIDGPLSDPDRGRRSVQGRGDWWMLGREPTHNSRSPFIGAQSATLKWQCEVEWAEYSSPAIAADGTIYVGAGGGLCAVNQDGTLKWTYEEMGSCGYSSPAIGVDGTVYVGGNDNYLYAINPDGSLKWRYSTGGYVSSPAIGADGTVYVGSNDYYLYAITDAGTEGTLKWRYETGAYVRSSPAMGADGTIYVGSDDGYLYAISDNESEGTLKWRYGAGDSMESSPAIGADATIYVGSNDDYLYAITDGGTEGTLKWRYETEGTAHSGPAIGADGTVYVGAGSYLHAFRPDGTLKWQYETGSYGYSSPAICANGTIFVGGSDGYFYAINPDGTLMWRYEMEEWWGESSPAIGEDGTVYMGSGGYLYAFHDQGTGTPPTISSAGPTWGYSGYDVTFFADVSGTAPFTYAWDFGGGATPDNSDEVAPTVTLTGEGEYYCNLAVTNTYGSDSYDFTLTVYEPGPGDWWMFGREPTHNRRSPYVGAQTDNVKWQYDTEGSESSPAIGADGTVYVGSYDGCLYAINSEGTLKWRYQTDGPVISSPAIGADGTIYVGSDDYYLYAIDPEGTLKWRYETEEWVSSSPAIGADGTVYVGSWDSYLYAITDNETEGTLKWRYQTDGPLSSSPAIGAGGTVYVGSWDSYLYAITDNETEGTLKWRYQTDVPVYSSPAIGADGTIYVGSHDGYLYAITDSETEGTLKWQYQTQGEVVRSSPAVGADGTVYVGSDDNYLYAVTDNETEGTLKWRYETGGWVDSSPAIGADGTVYVGSDDSYLYAITDDETEGTLKWRYQTSVGPEGVNSSPAIGADGTVYVGSAGYLYAFGD